MPLGPPIARFISSCLDATAEALAALCKDFFERADGELFLRARNACTNVEQQELFDAMLALRKARPQAEPELIRMIGGDIERFKQRVGRSYADSATTAHPGSWSLDLVDTVEFEASLALSAVIARTEARFKAPLYTLQQGLALLFGAPLDGAMNPFGPARLSHWLAVVLARLKLTSTQLQSTYGVWGEILAAHMGGIYEVVNRELAARGLTPTRTAAGGGQRVSLREQERCQGASTGRATEIGVHSSTPSPGGPSSVGSELDGPPAVPVPFEVAQRLLSLRRRLDHDATPSVALPKPRTAVCSSDVQVQPVTQRAFYDYGDLLSAFGTLHGEHASWPPLGRRDFGVTVRLLDCVRAGVSASPKQITTRHREGVELLERLLGSAHTDEGLDQGLRSQLARLELVLYRLCVADPSWLREPAHPVRHIIDDLGRIYGRLEGEEGLDPVLDRLIGDLAVQSDFDRSSLDQVLAGLSAAAAELEREYRGRVEALVEDCERQQALLKSRRPLHAGHRPSHVGRSEAADPTLATPRDWPLWVERAKRLRPGATITVDRGSHGQRRLTLVWIGTEHGPYVFVDARGRKAASMTLQELAVRLRRGTAAVTEGADASLVERTLHAVALSLFADVQAAAQTVGPASGPERVEDEPVGAAVAVGCRRPFDWGGWIDEVLASRAPELRGRVVTKHREGHSTPLLYQILPCAASGGEELAFPYPALETLKGVEGLDRLVLVEVLRWLGSSPALLARTVTVMTCLSAPTFDDEGFIEFALEALMQSAVPPGMLCFEVSEPALAKAQRFVLTLRELGCRFCLRGFGLPGTSAAQLRELPIDTLGVDRTLVSQMHRDRKACAAVRSVHEVGRLLGKKTLAESTGEPEVEAELQAIGVDLILRPELVPLHRLEAWAR